MARRGDRGPKDAGKGLGFPLSEVAVRPVRDAEERARWDRLMDERHYLGFRGMFGDGLRHVATAPDGRWLALLGWCAGSFKVGARDAWIGWAPEQQFRRLRLVANNCRFLVLGRGRVPNLASRALSLSPRCVPAAPDRRPLRPTGSHTPRNQANPAPRLRDYKMALANRYTKLTHRVRMTTLRLLGRHLKKGRLYVRGSRPRTRGELSRVHMETV